MYHNNLNVPPTMIKVLKPMIDELLNEIEKPSLSPKSIAANIIETDNTFEIQLATLGHTKETVSINVEENLLKVEGKTSINESKFKLKEFAIQPFKRSFNLPKNIDKDQIKARFENGILFITLTKSTPVSSKVEIL